MSGKKFQKTSDDWLKVLSILALFARNTPSHYSRSVVIAAFVIVFLSIVSKDIFYIVYLGVIVYLAKWAYRTAEPVIIGYAVLYLALGAVLVAEDERRRLGKGHLLSAIWWLGQFLIHLLDIRSSVKSSFSGKIDPIYLF